MNQAILKYISKRAINVYLAAVAVVGVLFMSHFMKWYWLIFGLVSVVGFFKYAPKLASAWSRYSPAIFEKKLFRTALVIRVVYVVFSYFFYLGMTGEPFEFHAADAVGYHHEASWIADMIKRGDISPYVRYVESKGGGVSHLFYTMGLGIQYAITSKSIFIARLLKALCSAWMCVLIYRLASRNFEENVGRLSAVLCMLMPNLIYYCGLHVREAEMVFVTVLFVERADLLLRQSKIDLKLLFTVLLVGISLFTFRTVLGAVAFIALFATVVFSSKKIVSVGKKLILGFFIVILLGISIGGRISSEVEEVLEGSATNQSNSMAWRAERKGGNSFAKYAGTAVFAPMIFTIPFPTVVETPNQENQRLIHGGNFVKNITSFFAILALLILLFSGDWRRHVLPIAFMCGYLMVIASSGFAHSERFHFPALPFALMFAAYGMSKLEKKHKRWFRIWLMLVFVAIVAWSWFKLAGRGM